MKKLNQLKMMSKKTTLGSHRTAQLSNMMVFLIIEKNKLEGHLINWDQLL